MVDYSPFTVAGITGVISVTGVPNQITVSFPTSEALIGIDPNYAGQSSITTLGVITTGTWNSDIIDPVYGGTGINNGVSTIDLASPVAGYVLTSDALGNCTLQPAAGDVLSVTGTANRITVSPTTVNPVVDIASTYAGQMSIITVGTITTGTWNSDIVAPTYGGTGLNNGSLTINLGGGSTSYVMTSDGSGNGTWQILPPSAVTSVSGTLNRITVSPTTGNCVVDIDSAYVGQTSLHTLGTISIGTWQATIIDPTYGGTGVNNGTKTINLGSPTSGYVLTSDASGNGTWQVSGGGIPSVTGTSPITANGVSGSPQTGAITIAVTGSALTKTDDTNVTLTLGGSPTTALLGATSITVGWTGQLGLTRGGTNASLTASNGGIFYSTATAGAILAGTATAGQMLQSGSSAAPSWSTTTYPATNAINTIMYASSANVLGSIAAANNGVLITSATGVPSFLAAGTTGQFLRATTGSPASWGTLTFNGNSGSVVLTGASVTFSGTTAASGGTLRFSGSGSTMLLNTLISTRSLAIGGGAGAALSAPTDVTCLGANAGAAIVSASNITLIGSNCGPLTIGASNTAVGSNALAVNVSGVAVTAVGYLCFGRISGSSAGNSTGLGIQAGQGFTTGNGSNVCIGSTAGSGAGGVNSLTGTENIFLGSSFNFGANNYTGSESSNIIIQNAGTVGDNNTIRIGTTGSGAGQQNTAYIAGVAGVSISNPLVQVINSSTGQMGSVASANNGVLITSNSGVPSLLAAGTTGQFLRATTGSPAAWSTLTLAGDTGSAAFTGTTLTVRGNGSTNAGATMVFAQSAGTITLSVANVNNTICIGPGAGATLGAAAGSLMIGVNAGNALSTGGSNIGIGNNALSLVTTTTVNTALGSNAGFRTTGGYNSFIGGNSGASMTTGNGSIIIGWNAMNGPQAGVLTGSYNIVLGSGAVSTGANAGGAAYTTTESNNILISSAGTLGDQNVIRIGTTGTGTAQQSTAFIAGTYNVTPATVWRPMVINASGQIGTATDTTGSGIALIGANCPASTLTAPYTWIKMTSSDGSTVWVPCWK